MRLDETVFVQRPSGVYVPEEYSRREFLRRSVQTIGQGILIAKGLDMLIEGAVADTSEDIFNKTMKEKATVEKILEIAYKEGRAAKITSWEDFKKQVYQTGSNNKTPVTIFVYSKKKKME